MGAEPQQGLTLILDPPGGDEQARVSSWLWCTTSCVASPRGLMRRERTGPYPLAYGRGPRGRDPAARRRGLRQGGGPGFPVRIGGAGDARGAHRPLPGGGPLAAAAGVGAACRSTWSSTTSRRGSDVVAVHEALDRLAERDERQARS